MSVLDSPYVNVNNLFYVNVNNLFPSVVAPLPIKFPAPVPVLTLGALYSSFILTFLLAFIWASNISGPRYFTKTSFDHSPCLTLPGGRGEEGKVCVCVCVRERERERERERVRERVSERERERGKSANELTSIDRGNSKICQNDSINDNRHPHRRRPEKNLHHPGPSFKFFK